MVKLDPGDEVVAAFPFRDQAVIVTRYGRVHVVSFGYGFQGSIDISDIQVKRL